MVVYQNICKHIDMQCISSSSNWNHLLIFLECNFSEFMQFYCWFWFTDAEISVFMALYRSFFPESSITPKLHFLEDHVMKWVKKYNTGFGLLGTVMNLNVLNSFWSEKYIQFIFKKIWFLLPGEQGIESIHSEFNTLKRSYNCIRNPAEQLLCVLKEHHRKCHPTNIVKSLPFKITDRICLITLCKKM